MFKISCASLLAAIFFVIGNALTITYYVKEYQRSHFDYDDYTNLDPGYIEVEWGFRIINRPLYLSAGILNVIAWFFLMFPIVHLSWILSQGGKKWIGLHIAIGVLILTGSLTEWISHVLYIGASMTSELLAREFNLDNWITSNSEDQIGWRTLEMTHIVTYGFVSAIGAIEWLILSVVMVLIHISVKRWRRNVDSTTFSACWNALGLFVALMSMLEFTAEVLRLSGFRSFAKIAFWYSSANRLILIPTWLVLLGSRLPYASLKLNQQAHMREQEPLVGTT
mmetsp:Transcript_27841/g.75749  ORF Transcript_27841/g.75749 Transcript_27841/m.75749 type:complete len:280 (+) Transcript_27841:308-1147(+)